MVDFLTYFHTSSPYSSSFVQSLPVAGYSGTLENFGKKSVLVGNVMAKTGSMTRVKNLAGYLRTRSGKTLAFAFIANNYCCGGARVKAIQEDMLKILYEY
jgi:D-alanyl-D-alanine carboxypeptidase/D-alanyl-D-alanine-endopeptidase (penicillin-binding protein 4)